MGFVPLHGTLNKTGRRRGSGHPSPVTLSIKKGLRSETGEIWQADRLRFRISEALCKEAGFKKGDKVQCLFDADNYLCLICLVDVGYTLCSSSGNPSSFDLFFHCPLEESTGFPSFKVQTGMLDAHAEEDGIVFTVPKPGSFVPVGEFRQGSNATANKHKRAAKNEQPPMAKTPPEANVAK